jgi:hypothetical protein
MFFYMLRCQVSSGRTDYCSTQVPHGAYDEGAASVSAVPVNITYRTKAHTEKTLTFYCHPHALVSALRRMFLAEIDPKFLPEKATWDDLRALAQNTDQLSRDTLERLVKAHCRSHPGLPC